MAGQLLLQTEGFGALRTAVAFGFKVSAIVVLEGHEVVEFFLADAALEEARLVCLLVVDQAPGVLIAAATDFTPEGAL